MKHFTFLLLILATLTSCKKDFDPENPDVDQFVQMLKKGSYRVEKGMPNFSADDIDRLLSYSTDTAHIASFPTNPISSRYPLPQERPYFILAECMLWTVEGVRIESRYGSLDPFLVNSSHTDSFRTGITGSEILLVADQYKASWSTHKTNPGQWKLQNPLQQSVYKWR